MTSIEVMTSEFDRQLRRPLGLAAKADDNCQSCILCARQTDRR